MVIAVAAVAAVAAITAITAIVAVVAAGATVVLVVVTLARGSGLTTKGVDVGPLVSYTRLDEGVGPKDVV